MKKSFEIIGTQFGNFIINEYDLIGRFIKNYHYWEYHLYEFYSQILTPESYCIDIGANIGFHTIQFGKLSKKVYAFEPQSLIYNQLCANILFNDLNNIIIPYKLALGDKFDKQQLWNIEHEEDGVGSEIYNWGGRGIIQDNYETERAINNKFREYDIVEIIPLDSLQIPQCDLIKIDIQGYEYLAFLGAQNTLQTYKPIILVENPIYDIQSKNFLKTMGYEIYRFRIGTQEDCIALHPENNKYVKALEIINSISEKYNIKTD